MKTWKQYREEILKDPEIKKEYDRLGPQYELIAKLIKLRIENGLTQKQLAEKIGTTQSALSRFELGGTNPSLAFMQKVAEAVDAELVVKVR